MFFTGRVTKVEELESAAYDNCRAYKTVITVSAGTYDERTEAGARTKFKTAGFTFEIVSAKPHLSLGRTVSFRAQEYPEEYDFTDSSSRSVKVYPD